MTRIALIGAGVIANLNATPTLVENIGPRHELLGWGNGVEAALILDIIGAIKRDETPPISGLDGLRAMDLALVAYRSATNSVPVRTLV
jgi:predicted dehydrogenase